MSDNLLDNALKHSEPGGRIVIEARVDPEGPEGEVVITISDSGRGITEKDLPRVFDRFYVSDASRSRAGAGLGQAIAREIIRLTKDSHGGKHSGRAGPF